MAGAAFLSVHLPLNLAPGDVFLALLLALGVGALLRHEGGPFAAVLGRSVPLLWLLTVGSVVSLLGVGFPLWALDHALRDFLSLVSFAIIGAYVWGRRRIADDVMLVCATTGVVVAISTILATGGSVRQAGALFRNPNYAAHFIATAVVVTAYSRLRIGTKVLAIAIMILGMIPTGSFGGLSVLVGAVAVVPYRRLHVLGPGLRALVRLILVVLLAFFALKGATAFETSDVDLGRGADSARFSRSSSTRVIIWEDALGQLGTHPMGVGPRGMAKRDDLVLRHQAESHNDYVGFLTEQGPLGFVAFLGIAFVIWRSLPAGGAARQLFVGLALSGVFREVVNFRHVWLALVLLALRDFNAVDPPDPANTAWEAREIDVDA